MIPIYCKIGKRNEKSFRETGEYGKNELIPVFVENNIFNVYLNREVRSTEYNYVNNAQQSGNEYGRAVRS